LSCEIETFADIRHHRNSRKHMHDSLKLQNKKSRK